MKNILIIDDSALMRRIISDIINSDEELHSERTATNGLEAINMLESGQRFDCIILGWLTLHAGIAGGADIILLPEIPYDINSVVAALDKRTKEGKRFSILAVAEGAISKEDAALSKKELKAKRKANPYPSISYQIGKEIEERTGQEVRITVPGHMQRGGEPCPYDRVISSRLGAAAARLIIKEKYGYMVGFKDGEIVPVPLGEVAGKLKMVDPDSSIIKEAKGLGICFGD